MIRVKRLGFHEEHGMQLPVDLEFFRQVEAFAKEQLAEVPKWINYTDVYVAVEEKTGEIVGVTAWKFTPDVQLFRAKPGDHAAKATAKMIDRLRYRISDLGYAGHKGLLYMNSKEGDAQRCDRYKEWLAAVGAVAADRFEVTV